VTTEDEVMRLLRRADPDRGRADAPPVDGTAYLAALGKRSTTVTLIDTEPTSTQPEGRRRWPIIAVAAAAVVAIVVGAVVLAARDDSNYQVPAGPPTTVAQPTTISQRPVDVTANADLSPMVEAYNAGRLDDFMMFFAPTATFYDCCTKVEHRAASAAFMAANDRWTLSGCTGTNANTVTCDSVRRDDFHGAAGLVLTEHLEFEFDTRGLITSYGTEPDVLLSDYYAFDRAFAAWLLDTHPEVARNYYTFLYAIGPLSKMPVAAKVPTALEYVDEFLAQPGNHPVET
jgi:hypothetical protein